MMNAQYKIALLLSGQVRDYYNHVSDNYNNLISPYKSDIFMSIWNLIGPPGCKSFSSGTPENCIEKYKPLVSQIIDKELNLKLTEQIGLQNNSMTCASNLVGKLYQENQATLLKQEYEQKNNFKYDIVIKSRPDLGVKDNIEPFFKLIDDNTILIPFGNDWFGGINDTFAIGSSHSINIYTNLINHIVDLNKISPIHPEKTLRQWLINTNKIRILRINLVTIIRNERNSKQLDQFYIEDNNII